MRFVAALSPLLVPTTAFAANVVTAPHVRLECEGIPPEPADAVTATIVAARAIYTQDFRFDMPQTVFASVKCGPDQRTRLFTDGKDSLFLTLSSPDKLARPARSGCFNLYGMCHELGHMAMYRTLKDRDWMTSAAAEGWAHYAGSVVVDRVFAAKGESLWHDPYDYRRDGTARLERQLAMKKPSPTARGAGQWQKLETIIGPAGFARLFAAWQAAGIDAARPSDALLDEATKLYPEKKQALNNWWQSADPLFVEPRSVSTFQEVRIDSRRLTGEPIELAFDDDASEGSKSIAGSGHARRFSSPGAGEWYVRAVSVYGLRYGTRAPPVATFDVALCDDKLRTIAIWKKPYGTFRNGPKRWVRMEVRPTLVPNRFYLCLNFRPTHTRGVKVGYDTSTTGNSLTGIPGKPGRPFPNGDWMIRVELDQPRDADSLTGDEPPTRPAAND